MSFGQIQSTAPMAAPGQLVVDEELLLIAVQVLADLEGGQSPFAVATGLRGFLNSQEFAASYRFATGEPLSTEARDFGESFFAALYTPRHHNLYFEAYVEAHRPETDPATADPMRTAVWSFLAAWTQRYGGIMQAWVRDGVVDPSLGQP